MLRKFFNKKSQLNLTRLKNGLRVASMKTNSLSPSISLGLYINVGSRNETQNNNGVCHFIEHLVFKGTDKRAKVSLEKEIEDIGGYLNAYTSREQTSYYLKLGDMTYLDQGVDILSDIIQNSKFSENSIEEERHVILQESKEVEKSVEEVLFDKLHMACFRDSSLGFTILGPEENIRTINKKDVLDFINENYTTDKMVFVGVGRDLKHEDLVNSVSEKFTKYKAGLSNSVGGAAGDAAGAAAGAADALEKPYFLGSELIFRNDDMGDKAHVAVGFEGVPYLSPNAVHFMLMSQIIGQYNKAQYNIVNPRVSGNLTINRIANKQGKGCCDLYSSFNTHYRDTGLFGWIATCDEVAVEHCIGELMFGVTSLSYSVTDEEVERAKRELLINLYSDLSSSNLCEEIGRHVLNYGRFIPKNELVKRLEQIDAEEIKRVAWNTLHDSEVSITGLGPLHGHLGYEWVRRQTVWQRY